MVALMGVLASGHNALSRMPMTPVLAKDKYLSLVNLTSEVGISPVIPGLPVMLSDVSDARPPREDGKVPDSLSDGRLSRVTVRVTGSQVTPRQYDADPFAQRNLDELVCVKFHPTRAERADEPIAR